MSIVNKSQRQTGNRANDPLAEPWRAAEDGEPALPLLTRRDLIVAEVDFQGEPCFVVKDPLALAYHRLTKVQFAVLTRLEQPATFDELLSLARSSDPRAVITHSSLVKMVEEMQKNGLLRSTRPYRGEELVILHREAQRKEFFQVASNLLFLKLPGWNPDRFLTATFPFVRILFHPVVLFSLALFCLSALFLIAREYAAFSARLPNFYSFFQGHNLPYLWASIAVTKFIHELGHAYVCRYFGADVHKIGVMVLMLSPTLYCDVTDSWMLKNKWHRIAISAAGTGIEMVLSAIAFYLWWWTDEGVIHQLCVNIFLVTVITNAVFNLNPLVRFDGYYILSDYLEIPNLKQQADQALQRWFCRYCLGTDTPIDGQSPTDANSLFALYAVAAWVYRWVLTFSIMIFLYQFLKPYGSHNFAFVLSGISITMMTYGVVRSMQAAAKTTQMQPLHKARFAASVIGVITVVCFVVFVPVPWWIKTGYSIEAKDSTEVKTHVAGRLTKIHARPGDQVSAGQTLLEFENPDLEDQLREAQQELAINEVKMKQARAANDHSERQLISEQIATVQGQIQSLERQLADLIVIAPVAGTILASEPYEDPSRKQSGKLPIWSGHLLEPRQVGAWVETGVPLLTIAPGNEMQAVLLFDQDDRNEIEIGRLVHLRHEHMPGVYHETPVVQIGHRQINEAPTALSNRFGGYLATTTGAMQKEALPGAHYQVVADLPSETQFLHGMRGQARMISYERSIAGWLWRACQQLFTFRL
ncbi:hypothetical protein [Lacunimicrobium album]